MTKGSKSKSRLEITSTMRSVLRYLFARRTYYKDADMLPIMAEELLVFDYKGRVDNYLREYRMILGELKNVRMKINLSNKGLLFLRIKEKMKLNESLLSLENTFNTVSKNLVKECSTIITNRKILDEPISINMLKHLPIFWGSGGEYSDKEDFEDTADDDDDSDDVDFSGNDEF